jgi:hypothetical protein
MLSRIGFATLIATQEDNDRVNDTVADVGSCMHRCRRAPKRNPKPGYAAWGCLKFTAQVLGF